MPIVRLPGGDLRDEIRQPIYDTLSVAGTAALVPLQLTGTSPNTFDGTQFFSQVNGKDRWQTNLLQANALQTAVSFRMQGMAIDGQYAQSNVTDATNAVQAKSGFLPAVQDFGSLRLRIGEKDYWEGPLAYLMGRIVSNAGTSAYQHTGQPAVQGVILSGRHVVDINPLQAFVGFLSVDVPAAIAAAAQVGLAVAPAAANDIVNLKFSLKGLLRRPVQ